VSKTIVIVGNGEPARNVSAEVDAADEIVRFGITPHIGSKMVGCRTTVLVARLFSLGEGHLTANKFPCLAAADTVWLLDDTNYKGKQLLTEVPEDVFDADMRHKCSRLPKESLQDKCVEFPSGNVRSQLREHFRERGFRDGTSSRTEPSAGVWVTVWVAACERYAGWNVKLAGFAMEYPSHPTNYEIAVLEQLRKEGRIEMI